MGDRTYYTYYTFGEDGRGYIGCKPSGSENPESDGYLGSFSDDTFNPTHKVVISTHATPEEALKAEVSLHALFEVAIEPHFANRAKQTSSGFTTAGTKQPEEWKSKAMVGLHTPEVEERRIAAMVATNRERKSNAFFNEELRAKSRKKAVEANRKNKTGCCWDDEYQRGRRLKHNWNKDAWEAIEKGLSTGKRYWGLNDVLEKYGISFSTAQHMKSHILAGKSWEDVMGRG